ncbi:TPA: hypothetical protein ACIYE5_005106, partial [Escherichia coli]
CATKISRGTHHVIRRKASCYEFRKPHVCLVVRIFYPSTSHETRQSTVSGFRHQAYYHPRCREQDHTFAIPLLIESS